VIDIQSKEKRLEDAYPLDRAAGVYALLYHINEIREMRFIRGDYAASILLLDFYQSLKEANLTFRQREILYFVFEQGLTQQEVAQFFNISQQAVSDHIKNAIRRIARLNRKKEANSRCA
jgi:predicted DNA-binding protein YlxM (UPF0122 family)